MERLSHWYKARYERSEVGGHRVVLREVVWGGQKGRGHRTGQWLERDRREGRHWGWRGTVHWREGARWCWTERREVVGRPTWGISFVFCFLKLKWVVLDHGRSVRKWRSVWRSILRLVMRLEMRLVHGSLGRTEGREGLQSCWVEGGMEVGRDLVWSGGSEGRG